MARDIKINYNQLTLGQLRRMCETFLALGDDQRALPVPERALMDAANDPASATADGGEGGSGGLNAGSKQKPSTPSPMAMETGEEDESAGAVVREEKNTATKKKKKKKNKSRSG